MSGVGVLDPACNRIPDQVHHIHIMGVCGTGMASLAGMLKERGFRISGSDENVYPPMSEFLAAVGIPVQRGYDGKNLQPRPDLVVVGNVIRATNPEAVALGELGIPYVSMPQALGFFFLERRTPLVVCGTHGKTTTSSLLASALFHARHDPGFLIGGIVREFNRSYGLGSGEYFVVEGDEYDTAFFDKESKFFHYRPACAILTSVEFDHADIFRDLNAIRRAFKRFIALLPATGVLVACGDDAEVMRLAGEAGCEVITYGGGNGCSWTLDDYRIRGSWSEFTLIHDNKRWGPFTVPLPGRHNILNSMAVIALLHRLGLAEEAISRGFKAFGGIKRRQQIRGVEKGITVIDDFAHHPTAVRETLAALKAGYCGPHTGGRLIAVFEPRTNSSRRNIFQEKYARAFDAADLVLVREHVPLPGLSRREQFSSEKLVTDLSARGINAHYFDDTGRILDYLLAHARRRDIIAVLSNGGFDNIHVRLLEGLRNLPATP